MTGPAYLLAASFALAGCQASQTYGQTTGTTRRPTTAVAASSSGGNVGTGGASSSGSSAGSTGGNGACPPASSCDQSDFDGGLNDCGDSQFELVANVIDFCNNGAPITCPVTVIDVDNPLVTGVSTGCGLFHVCFDAGSTLHLSATASMGYWPVLFANVEPTASTAFPSSTGQGVPLFCEGAYFSGLTAELMPTFDITKASVVAEVYPLHVGSAACDTTRAGWTFTLLDLDGGGVAAENAVVDGTGVSQGSVTTGVGIEFFYNIDPAVGVVRVVGSQGDAGVLGDGGLSCPQQLEQPPFYTTGTVDLAGGVFSFLPYVIL